MVGHDTSSPGRVSWPPSDAKGRLGYWLKRLRGLPHLIGEDDISAEEQWKFLDALYDVKPILSATGAVSVAAWFAWNRGVPIDAGLWMLSAAVVCIIRFMFSWAYRSRSSSGSVRLWTGRYLIAVILTGAQWGFGGLVLARSQDGAAASAVFGVEAALMAGAAARAYYFPIAVLLQINLTALMVAVFSMFAEQYVFIVLMLLYSAHQTQFVFSLGDLKLKELEANKERKTLLAALGQSNEELTFANRRLHEFATTDALTGIANRRSFDAEIHLQWAQASRMRTALSLLLVDVDHFKRFNDVHGHQAGDRCLALVATAMKSVVRQPSDHAARYGGEEFALILPDSHRDAAKVVAERLTAAVRALDVPVADNETVTVTVSVGIASLIPDGPLTTSALISMADQALYRAKLEGRDCVR